MQFKCVNCGGNVVYDPKSGSMLCMSCNSVNTEEIVKQDDCYACPSCGAKLTVNDFTSATKCEYCGSYNRSDRTCCDRCGAERSATGVNYGILHKLTGKLFHRKNNQF